MIDQPKKEGGSFLRLKIMFDLEKRRQVSENPIGAVGRLEHQRAEFAGPVLPGVKALDELFVELIEPLLGLDPLWHEDKVQAVHQFPLFLKRALVMDRLVDGRAGKGRELGHVHVVEFKVRDEIGCHSLSSPRSRPEVPS